MLSALRELIGGIDWKSPQVAPLEGCILCPFGTFSAAIGDAYGPTYRCESCPAGGVQDGVGFGLLRCLKGKLSGLFGHSSF